MTRPNITPGPWHYTKGVSPAVNAQQERHTLHIAKTIYGTHDEAMANARAIAAVPALLEALEIVDEAFSKLPDYGEAFTRPNGWSVQPMAKVRSALTAAGYQF